MTVKSIANFCCTDLALFKSPLCFDFTFDLGKSPPFFAFVGTYKNTSLYSKGTTVCPVMLGPILICHRKNEQSVQLICEELIKACEGLGPNVRVIGADGERSIHNQTLRYFWRALLLLCFKHTKDNVNDYITKSMSLSLNEKVSILNELFGTKTEPGIVSAETISEFDGNLASFYERTTEKYGEEGEKLVDYMKKNKQDLMRHHVITAAVKGAEICDDFPQFFNNASESINKMIKSWNQSKLDMVKFVQEYEAFIKNQENEIVKAFMGLPSMYEVRSEFGPTQNFDTDYAGKPETEKALIRDSIVNKIVDTEAYTEVMNFKASQSAVRNAQQNIRSILETKDSAASCASHTISHTDKQLNTSDFDTMVFTIMESVGDELASVKGSVSKAMKIGTENKVISGPSSNAYAVWPLEEHLKNGVENIPHIVTVSSTKHTISIKCTACKKYEDSGYCSHSIAVAVHTGIFVTYTSSLRQKKEESLTAIVSKKVNKNTGKKKPTRPRLTKKQKQKQLEPQQQVQNQQQQQQQQQQKQQQQKQFEKEVDVVYYDQVYEAPVTPWATELDDASKRTRKTFYKY